MAPRASVSVSASALALLCLLLAAVATAQCGVRNTVCRVSPQNYATPTAGFVVRCRASPGRAVVLSGPCNVPYSTCRNSCLNARRCASFQYNTATGACVLYKAGVGALGVTRVAGSPARFYNRGCFDFERCPAPPPPDGGGGDDVFMLQVRSVPVASVSNSYLSYVTAIEGSDLLSYTDSAADAATFSLTAEGYLKYQPKGTLSDSEFAGDFIYFDPPAVAAGSEVQCQNSAGTLTCVTTGGANTFGNCPTYANPQIFTTVPTSCETILLGIVPVA